LIAQELATNQAQSAPSDAADGGKPHARWRHAQAEYIPYGLVAEAVSTRHVRDKISSSEGTRRIGAIPSIVSGALNNDLPSIIVTT
jgi:hypothetical protein